MKSRSLPRFENYVRYDPITGHFFWLITEGSRAAGDRADHLNPQGYTRLHIEGRWHQAHRVAWYIMTGIWPAVMVDHRNLCRSDNYWENLRLATNSQNQMNRANRTGLPKGVTLHRQTGKFQAQIKRDGKSHYLGLFETAPAAHDAYVERAAELFGDFMRAA
jgi:hypothetical protein